MSYGGEILIMPSESQFVFLSGREALVVLLPRNISTQWFRVKHWEPLPTVKSIIICYQLGHQLGRKKPKVSSSKYLVGRAVNISLIYVAVGQSLNFSNLKIEG